MVSRAHSSVPAEEDCTLEEEADPPGPGRISGSGSLAGLVAEWGNILAVWCLVEVVGLVRQRLVKASKVPSGSTITLITETNMERHYCMSV